MQYWSDNVEYLCVCVSLHRCVLWVRCVLAGLAGVTVLCESLLMCVTLLVALRCVCVCVCVCVWSVGSYESDALISKRWGVSLGAISDTSLSEPSSAVAGLTVRKLAGARAPSFHLSLLCTATLFALRFLPSYYPPVCDEEMLHGWLVFTFTLYPTSPME